MPRIHLPNTPPPNNPPANSPRPPSMGGILNRPSIQTPRVHTPTSSPDLNKRISEAIEEVERRRGWSGNPNGNSNGNSNGNGNGRRKNVALPVTQTASTVTTVQFQKKGISEKLDSMIDGSSYGLKNVPATAILAKVKVDGPEYFWSVDKYEARDPDNAHIEGEDIQASRPPQVSRLGNVAQITTKSRKISGTLMKTPLKGAEAEEVRLKYKARIELDRDVEAIAWGFQHKRDGTNSSQTKTDVGYGQIRKTAPFVQFIKSENIATATGLGASRVTASAAGQGTNGFSLPTNINKDGATEHDSAAAAAADTTEKLPDVAKTDVQVTCSSLELDEAVFLKGQEQIAEAGCTPDTVLCGADVLGLLYALTVEGENRRLLIEETAQTRGSKLTRYRGPFGLSEIIQTFALPGDRLYKGQTTSVVKPGTSGASIKYLKRIPWIFRSVPCLYCFQRDLLELCIHRDTHIVDHGSTGDNKTFHITKEWGPRVRNTDGIAGAFDLRASSS